jgi:hypothetical protein
MCTEFDLTPYNAYMFYEQETGISVPIWFGSDETETRPIVKISVENDFYNAVEIDLVDFNIISSEPQLQKIYNWISLNYKVLLEFFDAYQNGGEHPITHQDMYEMYFQQI